MLTLKFYWFKFKLFQLKYLNLYGRLMTFLFGPVEHIPTLLSTSRTIKIEELSFDYHLACWVTGRKRLYRLGVNYPFSTGVYYPKDNAFLVNEKYTPEETIKNYILLMQRLNDSVNQLNHLIVEMNSRSPIFKA
ncbi:hypothetical protein [Aeromonas phage AerS_266]|nr:hypothetical protein [Aeromonas phage AerS_266]